jgi:hypothetical protein
MTRKPENKGKKTVDQNMELESSIHSIYFEIGVKLLKFDE